MDIGSIVRTRGRKIVDCGAKPNSVYGAVLVLIILILELACDANDRVVFAIDLPYYILCNSYFSLIGVTTI